MSTTLYRSLLALAAFQREITVSDPPLAIAEAYPLPPAGRSSLAYPCFLNRPTGLPETMVTVGGKRIRTYEISTWLMLGSGLATGTDMDEAVCAFDQAWQDAWALNTKLGETATTQLLRLRGDDPWYGGQEWNGLNVLTLAYLFDMRIDDVAEVGIGAGVQTI